MPPVTIQPRSRRLVFGIICLGILAAIAVAGLRPFNPWPGNQVTWIGDQNGLRFNGAGIVLGSSNLNWPSAASSTETCSLELWLRPERNTRTNNILTFYTLEDPQRFRIFQWAATTLLLYRDVRNEHREIDIEDVLRPGIPLFVTVTSGPRGSAVYLNGALKQTSSRLRLSPADLAGQLILGSSPLDAEPWSGEIRGIAIYGAELTPVQVSRHFDAWSRGESLPSQPDETPIALYDFSERSGGTARDRFGLAPELSIPDHFQVPHKRFLAPPSTDFQRSRDFLRDIFINVAGFMALGFFFCMVRAANSDTRSAVLFAVAAGAAVSMSVETLQMFLPTRSSSIVDLAANMIGAALGALACALLPPERGSGESRSSQSGAPS